jgi:hypothetical protein
MITLWQPPKGKPNKEFSSRNYAAAVITMDPGKLIGEHFERRYLQG